MKVVHQAQLQVFVHPQPQQCRRGKSACALVVAAVALQREVGFELEAAFADHFGGFDKIGTIRINGFGMDGKWGQQGGNGEGRGNEERFQRWWSIHE